MSEEPTVKERFEASIKPDLVALNADGEGLAPFQDLTADFSRVKAPTLLIWGADDRAGALDVGLLMLKTFQNAEMHIYSRCGHWAQVECRDQFNELVLAYLGSDEQ